MTGGRDSWQVLSGLPAWQVLEIPRPDEEHVGSRDDGAVRRAQALTAAFSTGSPVVVGWVRERAGGPVRVVCGGPAMAAAHGGDLDVLALPSGARGRRLTDGQAAEFLGVLSCWRQVGAVADVLLAHPAVPESTRPSLEDGLLSVWLGPFAWLMIAEPAGSDTISAMTAEAAQVQLGAQGYSSPVAQLAARRAEARHDELRQAASTGLWNVHLLAGAATEDQARQVAGLLRASFDLADLPYALAPGDSVVPVISGNGTRRGPSMLDDPALSWARSPAQRPERVPAPAAANPYSAPQRPASSEEQWPSPSPQAPFWASTALVAALARVPVREVPGVRMVLRPEFDLTPETSLAASGTGFALGEVLDWNKVPSGMLSLPLSSVNRHVFVCGATGSGKSQTIRHLLESATGAGIPWLVIEPAKSEYRLMAARLSDARVITIRPGALDAPAAGINPLEPAGGFPLQAHADLLRALFLAAFDADEPFPQVLSAALTRCYEQAGWDLVTGQPSVPGVEPSYPGLGELQAAATAIVEEAGYGREVTDNVRGFVQVRLGSLRLGTAGRFLDGAHRLDFGRLLDANVVLEIEDCGDDRDKAFLTGAVLIRLAEHLRARHRDEPLGPVSLRHITVVEEAHRLLRQPPAGTGSGPAAHAVEMFADLLAEIRAYGEGLIIAEQIPSKLVPDVIKNTAVKVVHRLPAADDRDTVGATMNLRENQSRYLVTLLPGEAAVHADGMDYPLLARMPDGTARETTAPGAPASPATMITPRSPGCPPDCASAPCTLRQTRAAQLAAGRDSKITLWAELLVVGHLTGWVLPSPSRDDLAVLNAMETRLRDCVFAHAADAAVTSRIPAFATLVSGVALTAHVAAAMRDTAAGRSVCPAPEPQWLAPAYQWSILADDLRDYDRDHPGGGRHPATADWEALYGRPIPGETCAEQLRSVRAWDEAARRDQHQISVLTWGSGIPSAVEQAAGMRQADPGWDEQFTEMLGDFSGVRWPIDQFRQPPPGG